MPKKTYTPFFKCPKHLQNTTEDLDAKYLREYRLSVGLPAPLAWNPHRDSILLKQKKRNDDFSFLKKI